MAQIINTTFKFKRGTANRWLELNPILQDGEPGFELDTGKLKIGNGQTPWVELPYMGEDSVQNFDHYTDFPVSGEENVIYKAELEKAIYQWNSEKQTYECLNEQIEIDEAIFELENNKLKLQGFEDAAIGMNMVKGEDGKVSWVDLNKQVDEKLENFVMKPSQGEFLVLYGGSATDNIG